MCVRLSALTTACVSLLMMPAAQAAVPTQMDFTLMEQVTKDLTENQAISPFLMSSLLTQIWLGAGGTSRSQLGSTLGISRTNRDASLRGYKSAATLLSQGSESVITGVFNKLYIQADFSVKPSFRSLLRRHFMTGAETFSSPEQAVSSINSAVSAATRDKIPTLVTVDDMEGVPLALVSALYFKGSWEETFQTLPPSPFLTVSGDKPVTMMGVTKDLLYGTFPLFDVVSLPYTDPDYSLLVLRPLERTVEAAESLRSALDTLDIDDIYSSLSSKQVTVTMPRFKIDVTYANLKEDLEKIGIRDPFDRSKADLSGITDDPRLFVSSVILKVFMEVNEEGTEAAAAAVALFGIRSGRVPFDFTCDRPFFAVLYNNREKLNLFTAFVTQPNP